MRAAPPAVLTNATSMPSTTRNMKMPALSATAGTSPSPTMVSSVVTGLNPATSRAPMTMPTNKDTYTSLVTSAKTMAMIAGARAQAELTNSTSVPFCVKLGTWLGVKKKQAFLGMRWLSTMAALRVARQCAACFAAPQDRPTRLRASFGAVPFRLALASAWMQGY